MIEEGHAPFNRVRHFHAVAEQVKDVGRQKRFGPDEKRFIQRVPPVEHGGNVKTVEEKACAIAALETSFEIVAEQAEALLAGGGENFQAPRHETKQSLRGIQRAGFPG